MANKTWSFKQTSQNTIHVLVVDDEADMAELTGEFLDRNDALETVVETSAADGLDRLAGDDIDCIVSDYEMPIMDGLEFLDKVREDHPDLPFILFTGRGSEEIASEAISRGVTDYVQKGGGTDCYDLLLKRIETAVSGHRAQHRIRQQHEQLRELLESLPAMVCVDIQGECVYVNQSGAELFHADDPAELIGGTITDWIHPDDREDVEESASTGQQMQERRVMTVDGTVKHVEAIQTPITWQGEDATLSLVRDISERKRRERKLEAAKTRYQQIFEQSNDAILVLDPFEDTIQDANPGACELLGYSYAELVDSSPSDIHPHEMDQFKSFVDSVYEEGTGWTDALSCLTQDGQCVPAEISASVIDRDGQSLMLAIVRDVRDIATREHILETLHDATREMVAADSRQAIAEIASRTATDVLDLPVNGVYLYDKQRDALIPAATSERNEEVIGESPMFQRGEGVAWTVYETGEKRIHSDIREAPALYNPDTAIRSEAILPLGEHGVLIISSPEVDAFDEAEVALAQVLAANVETALDRAEREREFRETTRQLQAVLDTVEAVIFIKDTDGRYQLLNKKCKEMVGLDPDEEVVGLTDNDLFPEEIAEQYREDDQRVLAKGETIKIEEEVPTPDGTQTHLTLKSPLFDEEGNPAGVCAVSTEITERKRRERALQARSTAMEASIDGMAILDDNEEYVFVNQAHCDIYGYDDPEAFIGETWHMCYDEEELERFEEEVVPALYEDGAWRGEAVGTRKDGSTFPQELSLTETDDGGMVCVVRDITDRVAARTQLEHQNERLEEFASIISHDLRNPLNVATGRLALAQQDCDSEHLDTVVDALERMETIVEGTLTLAQEGRTVGETEPVNVSDLIEESWQTVTTLDAELRSEDVPRIQADRDRLRHMFENLFRNAIEYGGDDVTIRVGQLVDPAGIYIEDDGPGIPNEEREDVFEPGYTTAKEGSGLGLNIVKSMTKAHGWDISVTDGDEGGARFEITGVEFVDR